MSKQTLRVYYDTYIKSIVDEDMYYYIIKKKMDNGKRCWRVAINECDLCCYQRRNYLKLGNIYITNPHLMRLIDYVQREGLDIDHVVENNMHYLMVPW